MQRALRGPLSFPQHDASMTPDRIRHVQARAHRVQVPTLGWHGSALVVR